MEVYNRFPKYYPCYNQAVHYLQIKAIDLWYFAKFVGKFKLTPQFSFVKLVEILSGRFG